MDFQLSEEDYCRLFWAFSDPIRLRILRTLATSERNVSDLARHISQSVARTSHHLRILTQLGLVEDRREGKSIFYTLPKLASQLDAGRGSAAWGGQTFEVLSVLASVLTTVQLRHAPAPATAVELRLAAASDLVDAFSEILPLAEREFGFQVRASFGSSGALADQIAGGEPVDVFAAARPETVDDLIARGLLEAGSRTVFARGRLTVWHRQDAPFVLRSLEDLARPEVRWIAIAHPDHAPHGAAAREALMRLGVWERVEKRLIIGSDSHQALKFADADSSAAAIVPLSLSPGPKGRYAIVPGDCHAPLDLTLAVSRTCRQLAAASAFVAFLEGPIARPILKKYGFLLPEEFRQAQAEPGG
ncbi:MAG: molybdate ABC transporter substrate-binding protein [Candidatus Sericytochromatia bacterium]|nr:molybdate ABC transporter substrate-binding protein [Candidatus Tanganyikabacteria bacterium]